MNLLKYVFAVAALIGLAACGGGGGNPGTSSGGTSTTAKPTLVVQFFNSSNVEVNGITSTGGNYAKVTFKDAAGSAIAGRTVTFSVSSTIATLASTTALTNEAGEAQVGIYPTAGTTGGAATLQAQALVNDDTATAATTGKRDFAVGSSGAAISPYISVQIFNSANAAVSNVTSGGGNYAKATFKDGAGLPIANRLVTFSASSAIATLAATTALTNSAGEAQVGIYPTLGTTAGAATLQVQAIDGKTTFTATLDFAVASAGVPISPYIVVQIFDSANKAVSSVTFGGGNYVKATFKDANGAPIVNKLVTFSLNGAAIAVISPATALTNSSGEAQVSIAPVSVATAGAATLSAQAQQLATGPTYSVSTDFGVAAASITLGPLTLGSNALNPGGNTSVTISAQSNAVAAAGVNVAFTADCGTINPVATTDGSGVASATYSAVKSDGTSCRGLVTLSASAVGATLQKATLTVAAPVANAVNFVSATPAQIFVKGSGATEQAIAKFKVLDSTGVAMPNISVVFSLTMNPGGVGLGASGAPGNVTVNSDALGIASVSIFSGTIPGPVEVKAALASAPTVFTTSKNLTVASGPPSQNHFSLSVDTFNIEGENRDGSSANLTVRVADRQGNPVPDGTVINFTAEGGQVATSCATARVDGIAQCSVAFISQNPRPADGRVSVLAYAEGLKEFVDVNGNNAYDAGIDTLVDIGDAYRDDNEDGMYNVGEFVIPKGGVSVCAGWGGASPSRADTCTGNAVQAITVRQQAVLMFASSSASFLVTSPAAATNISFVSVRINSAGHPLLPMPAGTTVSADALSSTCTIGKISPSIVPNTSPGTLTSQLGSIHSIGLTGCGGSTIIIKATAPSGVVSSYPYSVPAVYVPVCTPPETLQNGVCVAPPDTTPPTSLIGVNGVTVTGATLIAQLNETGTGYYIVQLTSLPAPLVGTVRLTGTALAMSANTSVSTTIGSLTSGSNYTFYFVAKDTTGNLQSAVSSVGFTTDNPPVTTALPTMPAIATTTATLSATIDENGTGYYLVKLATDPPPSVSTVVSTGISFAMVGNVSTSTPVTGLTTATAYRLYFVAKDTAGNIQSAVSSVNFTTP